MVRFDKRFSTTNQSWGFVLVYEYTFTKDGKMSFNLTGDPYERGINNPTMIPRIGIEAYVSGKLNQVKWFGMGPGENYVDSLTSSEMGIYESSVEDQHTPYVFPQENGSHTGTEWLELQGSANVSLNMKDDVSFSYHNYTKEMVEEAKHTDELGRSSFNVLNIDYKQLGLGSNSCGPIQQEKYWTTVEPFEIGFTLNAN